jgi:hypothetical protein
LKALFEKIELGDHNSLRVMHVDLPYFDAPWHFIPNTKLTYIARSHGNRFVGDHVEPFDAGDLVLLGPGLPHFWRNDDDYTSRIPTVGPNPSWCSFPSRWATPFSPSCPKPSR